MQSNLSQEQIFPSWGRSFFLQIQHLFFFALGLENFNETIGDFIVDIKTCTCTLQNIVNWKKKYRTLVNFVMDHVNSGDRVYNIESDSFGDVKRTRFLGKSGAVLTEDDGTLSGYPETVVRSKLFNKVSRKNGIGESTDTPMDVRIEGVSILSALNIDPVQQRLMFVKFMGMFSKEERRAYVTEWIEKRDDPIQRTIFLNNIVEALDDDDVFIRNEGRKAFFDIEEELQKKMFTSTRDEFLQQMYEILMDDEDYIQFEGRKALDSLRIPVSRSKRNFFLKNFISLVE